MTIGHESDRKMLRHQWLFFNFRVQRSTKYNRFQLISHLQLQGTSRGNSIALMPPGA